MLLNKKNKLFKQEGKEHIYKLEQLEDSLKDKMEDYKKLPQDYNLRDKVLLYKEISFIKNKIREIKYDKINTINDEEDKETFILEVNEDIEYPEIYDITEDDNEIPNPYIELKKNVFNIPNSLQIIL